LREQRKKTIAADNGRIIISRIKSVISNRCPDLLSGFKSLKDSRNRKEYSMEELLAGALFMFIFKQASRNAYNNKRGEIIFAKNYYRHFRLRLPHPDAIDQVLRDLPPELLEELKAQLVGRLFEQKLFRKFRLLGKYYLVAVDATGIQTFQERHCEHCLTKTSKNGHVTYFHYVLEAKLVSSSGHAISLATEFIENQAHRDFDKQDCEQKAFVRLAAKIKRHFPRLPICILADGLYPNDTTFSICRKNDWRFIITLKEGCLKTFNEEVGLLNATAKGCSVYRASKTTRTLLDYRFLNDIQYNKHNYSWVSCIETVTQLSDKSKKVQQFVYITDLPLTLDNVVNIANGGRLRWKIENEGFNTQKNLGYELEHKYSRVSYNTMQNYYQLLQIAQMINQFTEKARDFICLMNVHSKQTIKDLWEKLLTFMASIPYNAAQLQAFMTG
jgi:hypothetical protein